MFKIRRERDENPADALVIVRLERIGEARELREPRNLVLEPRRNGDTVMFESLRIGATYRLHITADGYETIDGEYVCESDARDPVELTLGPR